ncbi:MAG: hypothetical protein PHR77_19245, partial [Kiritimatiellae bacterium]|nr:hypothetical protein [Kiritimatiellia bacterium]
VNKIGADGSISVSNLILSGSPLGTDKPKMDSLKLEFSVLVNNKSINIRSFNLNSPFLTATASGDLVDKGAKYPAGNIVMNARLDIPRLAGQIPATLRIEKGVLISKGDLTAKAEIQSVGDSLSCLANIKLADVEAKSDGRIMTLSHPVQLESKVILTADGPRIERCLLSSSFANMSGRGDLRDMQVTLNADIALALAEARKFIALGKISAAGKISSVSRIQSVSATERNITGRMTLEDLKVAGLAPSPFVMNSARAGVDMVLKTTADGAVANVSALKMFVESMPLSAKADVVRIVPGKKPESTDIQGMELKARVDVKNLFALGRGMGLVQADNDGSGMINVTANGKMQEGLFAMSPFAVDAADMKFSAKKKKISEPQISLRCSVEADAVRHKFRMTGLNIVMSAGKVDVPLVGVDDWTSKVPVISGSGNAKISLEKLASQMSDFLSLPKGSSVSGNLDGGFAINQAKNAQSISIETVINNLKIKPAAGPIIGEPVVSLTMDSDQDNISGDIIVKKFKLDSSMLALSAEGSFKDLKKEKLLLLDGLMTCDFKRIGEIVTALGGTPVEMEGKRETKFHLNTSLAESDWKKMLQKTDANTGLYLSKLKAFGMEITGLEFNASAAKGLVKTDINTKVNDGDLKIKPEINAVTEPAFLVIADNSQVLRNVKITDAMMSDLIGRVHPVLRGCVVTSGQTDLVLRKCYVPLDERLKDKINVEGEFILKNVVLVPGGFLKTLLDVSSLEVKPLSIPSEVVTFVCRNGKLEPSPLTIGNKDYKITFSGYVTLDGMVKYVAQVPVTERLVGKDAFKYLENVTVKVPIEGPVAKPVISSDAIKSATSNLVKDAAKNAIKEEGGKLLKDVLKKKGGSLLKDILK